MHTHMKRRHRVLAALAVVPVLAVGGLAAAEPAGAATTDPSFHVAETGHKLLSGCTTDYNATWDRATNHASISATLSNGYWFKGCRATYQLKFYDESGNPIWAVQQHQITACATFDPCSSHPHNRWEDDYAVPPAQRLAVTRMQMVLFG